MFKGIDTSAGKKPLRWMQGLLLAAALSGSAMHLWVAWHEARAAMEEQVLAAQSVLEAHARDTIRHQEGILRVLGENVLMRQGHFQDAKGLIGREERISGFSLYRVDGSPLMQTGGWESAWGTEAARLARVAASLKDHMAIGKPQSNEAGKTILPIAIKVFDERTGKPAIAVAGWDVENLLGRLELESIDRRANFWLFVKTDDQFFMLTEKQVQRVDDPRAIALWVAQIEDDPRDPTETSHERNHGLVGTHTHGETQHGNISAVWTKSWPSGGAPNAEGQEAVGAVCQVEPWAASIGASLPVTLATERFWQNSYLAFGWGVLMLIASLAAYRIMSRSHSQYERKLIDQASSDPLTGLGNRLRARDHLEMALARTERTGKFAAAVIIDLDNFKELNDARGHEAGDRLLVAVGEALRNTARKTDTVSRQGGDEFLVICGDLNSESDADVVAEKIVAALRQAIKATVVGLRVSASVGVAVAPRDGTDPDDLLRKADRAMYAAKAKGKDILQFYDDELNKLAQRRLAIERGLDGAIERNEIWLALQPQWDAATGECIGFEALSRWTSAELGNVSPAEFVPIAEDIHRICGIGAFALREALVASVRLSEAAGRPVRASVNISAKQFRDENLGIDVAGLLAKFGIDGGNLILEVTESAMVKDFNDAVVKLHKLRALGIGISVDDFGTGYSSLSYLHRLPATELKIDQSFVRNMEDSPSALELTTAIAGLGKSLGLEVVAEGVETEGQAARLREMGVNILQGYLLGKPMPIDELETILRNKRLEQA